MIAYCAGLDLNASPSVWKILIEGIIYHVGLAIIEELYVRGLLLNLIEKLFGNNKQASLFAIFISSIIFGLGHIFGVIGESPFVIVSKVITTISLGLYFGAIYKKTNNLYLPIIMHFIINVCALPYCFTDKAYYPSITLYILTNLYSIWNV